MKILIYAHAFAPKVGGAETLVMMLAEGLARFLKYKDGNVTVLTSTPGNGLDDRKLPYPVVRQPNLWRILRMMRDADVIHLAGPCLIPMLLGFLLRKPTVVEHHGFQTICPNGLLLHQPTQMPCPGHFMARRYKECLHCNSNRGTLTSTIMWLLTFLRRWLCGTVSMNISITEWLGELLKLPNTKVVHCGVPERKFDTVSKTPSPLPTFAYMGRLVKTKGVHVLLDAMYILKKEREMTFDLKVIGDGAERENLESQSNSLELNDQVSFTGYLPEEKLDCALRDVSVIVMPSLAGETFGLVAAENMASGRLLIVSDVGALSEVVTDAGLKFPQGDANALSDCLRFVLERPNVVTELGSKARERALRHFRQEKMVEEHYLIYDSLLKN